MIKTVTLTANEVMAVELMGGCHAKIENRGTSTIYVSKSEDVAAGADGTMAVSASATKYMKDAASYTKTGDTFDYFGTIYIVSSEDGIAEIETSDYFFNEKNSSKGGGGGDIPSDVYTKDEVDTKLGGKVDKISGKGLSANDFTTAEKTKLAGLNNYDDSALQTAVSKKVDKISGKGLSTNDFTTAEKNKLAGLSNYDDTAIRVLIADKADKEAGKSLVSDTEIERLANVHNYDDTALQQAVGNKVGFTDWARSDRGGVVKVMSSNGISASNGVLMTYPATSTNDYAGEGDIRKPITPRYLNIAMEQYGINSKNQIADMQGEFQFENLIENYTIPKSYTHKGITFTTNSDGSITVTGQSTATYSTGAIIRNINIEHRKYYLTGCPDGGSDITFRLATVLGSFSTGIDVDYGEGTVVDNTDGKYDSGGLGVMMVIYPGINFTENPVTFRPMLIPGDKPYHRYESMVNTRAALRRDIDAIIALM